MLHDRLKKRRHVFVVFMSAIGRIRCGEQLAHGKPFLCARVNDWEIELLVGCLQLNKKIENHIDDSMRPRIFPVDLVDDNDRLQFVLERLAQNETGLRLRSVVGIDDQKHAVHHFHDALDFASKIRVPRGVDDVDPIPVPVKSRIFRANGDSLLALEIHRIHYALLDFLIGAKRP